MSASSVNTVQSLQLSEGEKERERERERERRRIEERELLKKGDKSSGLKKRELGREWRTRERECVPDVCGDRCLCAKYALVRLH